MVEYVIVMMRLVYLSSELNIWAIEWEKKAHGNHDAWNKCVSVYVCVFAWIALDKALLCNAQFCLLIKFQCWDLIFYEMAWKIDVMTTPQAFQHRTQVSFIHT